MQEYKNNIVHEAIVFISISRDYVFYYVSITFKLCDGLKKSYKIKACKIVKTYTPIGTGI